MVGGGGGDGLRKECDPPPPQLVNRKSLCLLCAPFIMSNVNIFKGQAES